MTTPVPIAVPRRASWYWPCQIAGWTGVVLFNLSFGGLHQPTGAIVAVCLWGGASGLLLSDAWHRLVKRREAAARPLKWPALTAGIVLLAALQSTSMWLAFLLFQPFGAVQGYGWIPNAMLFWLGCFGAWTIFYTAVLSMRRARHAEAQALRLALQAKDVELRALQAQVNPHFFFNSLNSVRALIYEDADAAALMIDRLAELMRHALQAGQAHTVPLATELAAVEAYLAIEKIRFEQRLRCSIDIEAGLEHTGIPPMALQTLVENAVKYGVEANAAGSDIRIRAWQGDETAWVEVSNTGTLGGSDGSTRVGIANARKRLALVLGERATLDLDADGEWVRATLCLPRGGAGGEARYAVARMGTR